MEMDLKLDQNVIILGSILLARAEPPVTSYSITGDNAFDYNSNVIKDGHRENTDFYSGGNSGHSLSNVRSQSSLEDSLRSNSYSGFSQNSHNSGFQGFSSNARDNLGASSYFVNDPVQSSFEGYTNNNNNADSTFAGYTQGVDQMGSDFNQFSSNKHKSPSYMRFSDNLPGASNTGSFPELTSESSSFRDYSADTLRGHTAGGYMDGDQAFNREPSSLFNGPTTTDYSYGKHKEGLFGSGNSNKYANDVYSPHPETRYVRGNHGNGGRDYGSPTYLSSSGNSFIANLRGGSDLYNSGKYTKYNKYSGDYTPNTGSNYLSKDQETDYSLGNYGKGKVTAFKDSRPSSYSTQTYPGGPSYLSKIAGGYKIKPNYMSYPSSSSVGYSPMPNVHGNFNSNSYTDSPMLRRYRSSSGYIPGYGNIYAGYY
nr:probable serine/threonine-protein kinase clkA isoform X1 [Nomia melanderi]